MRRSKNLGFMEEYILLEAAANKLMGRNGGGLSRYIAELEHQDLDTGAADTVKLLKKCRAVRNKLAHDPGALRGNSEITKSDIKKIKKLTSLMKKKRDPLSLRLKSKKKRAAKIKLAILAVAVISLVLAALILYNK